MPNYNNIRLDDIITLAVGESYIIKPTFDPHISKKVVGTIIKMDAFQGHLDITFVTDQKLGDVPIKTIITVGIVGTKKAFSISNSGTIERILSENGMSSKSPTSKSKRKSSKCGASVRRRKTLKSKK